MILVTGANGLVGSFICKALRENNIPFRGLVRKDGDLTLVEEIVDNLIYGEFLNLEFMAEEIQKFDIIIHCAAVISFAKNKKDEMFRVNVEGTKQLVNLALASDIDYFLYVSSVAAIGRSKAGIVNETKNWTISKENTWYGESKHLAELEVWRAIEEGLTACIINPSIVLGPGNWNKSSTQLFKYIWDENPFYGKGKLNYVDVRDVASITLELLEKRIDNERFILSSGASHYQDFFRLVAKGLSKRPPKKELKNWQGQIAVMISYLMSLIKNSQSLFTRETIRQANDITVFDSSKIQNFLDYKFKKLHETVMWTTKELTRSHDK
ncbi:MAG: NAD-dependent epimerase/dehydratase family protein [Bacteroidota bacterium]